jgi:hypothetical protein
MNAINDHRNCKNSEWVTMKSTLKIAVKKITD